MAEQQFYEAQQQLITLNKNICTVCRRIFKDIVKRYSKETLQLFKDRVDSGRGVTKIEYLEQVLREYTELLDQTDLENANTIEFYKKEVEYLKAQNSKLKSDLRRAQEQSEELDRVNESLGGKGLGSLSETVQIDFSGYDRLQSQVVTLESELTNVRAQLNTCVLRNNELLAARSVTSVVTMTEINTSEILRRVQGLVPIFSGEKSVTLHDEVYRFIDGVTLVLEGVTSETHKKACLKMIKQRMQGDAYNLVRLTEFTNEKDLIKLIKSTYLKTRALDSVYMEIWGATQKPDESIREYARRLKNLSNTARALIRENYENAQDGVVLPELEKKLRTSFIAGLRDKVVGSSLLHSPVVNIDDLLNEALIAQSTLCRGEEPEPVQSRVCFTEQASDRDSDNMASLIAAVQQLVTKVGNSNSLDNTDQQRTGRNDSTVRLNRQEARFPPCSFCKRQGHTREDCWTRRNTPYCYECQIYGHERGRSCKQDNNNLRQGGFNNRSQGYNNGGQRWRDNIEENRNAQGPTNNRVTPNPFRGDDQRNRVGRRDISIERVDQRNSQTNRNERQFYTHNRNRDGQGSSRPQVSHNNNNRGSRTEQLRCFSCGMAGHIRTECRNSENH